MLEDFKQIVSREYDISSKEEAAAKVILSESLTNDHIDCFWGPVHKSAISRIFDNPTLTEDLLKQLMQKALQLHNGILSIQVIQGRDIVMSAYNKGIIIPESSIDSFINNFEETKNLHWSFEILITLCSIGDILTADQWSRLIKLAASNSLQLIYIISDRGTPLPVVEQIARSSGNSDDVRDAIEKRRNDIQFSYHDYEEPPKEKPGVVCPFCGTKANEDECIHLLAAFDSPELIGGELFSRYEDLFTLIRKEFFQAYKNIKWPGYAWVNDNLNDLWKDAAESFERDPDDFDDIEIDWYSMTSLSTELCIQTGAKEMSYSIEGGPGLSSGVCLYYIEDAPNAVNRIFTLIKNMFSQGMRELSS